MKDRFLFLVIALFVCSFVSAQSFPINKGGDMFCAQFSYSSTGGDLFEARGNLPLGLDPDCCTASVEMVHNLT